MGDDAFRPSRPTLSLAIPKRVATQDFQKRGKSETGLAEAERSVVGRGMTKAEREMIEELRRIRMLLTIQLIKAGVDPVELTALVDSANGTSTRESVRGPDADLA